MFCQKRKFFSRSNTNLNFKGNFKLRQYFFFSNVTSGWSVQSVDNGKHLRITQDISGSETISQTISKLKPEWQTDVAKAPICGSFSMEPGPHRWSMKMNSKQIGISKFYRRQNAQNGRKQLAVFRNKIHQLLTCSYLNLSLWISDMSFFWVTFFV